MNPSGGMTGNQAENRSKPSAFRAGSLGAWHMLLLFLPFLVAAVIISVRIMRSELEAATQRLITQSATASRNLETQFDSLRDDFRMLVSTGAFDAYVTETPNVYWNIAMVRRFVARYQEVLEAIDLELEGGKQITLEITPGNYFRTVHKDQITGWSETPASLVRHTGNLITLSESVPKASPSHPSPDGPRIRRISLQMDHNRFFHFGLANHMIGQSNLWIWSIDGKEGEPALIRDPQPLLNRTFRVDARTIHSIRGSLQMGLEGVENHGILVPAEREVVSVFTPILLEGESMGLVFSTDRQTHLSSLHRLTTLLSVIFIGSFVVLIGWFAISHHRVRESERQQADARLKAEAADRAKSEFVAVMSHEIRTPLNGILGYADLLKGSPLTSEQQHYLEVIRNSGSHLLNILNDILDLSKISSANMNIRQEAYSPVKCAEEVIDMMSRSACDQGLELHLKLEGEIPEQVLGDSGRLRQIIYNLVGNGIKFTPKGSVTVTIKATEEADLHRLDFTVSDTGIGIPSDKRSLVFSPFSQIDGSNARAYGGTGLGLAICQRLVEMMGGRIDFTSQLGIGSDFRFHIKVGRVRPINLFDSQRKNILLFHSNRRFIDAMAGRITSMGHHVITASECNSIPAILREVPSVDLALIGWNGNPDEVEAIRRLLEHNQKAIPPMIAIACKDSGICIPNLLFTDQLTRPIRHSELEQRITGWLDSRNYAMPARNQTPLRVLVAEDNPVNSQLMAALLKQYGAMAELAVNGREALEKISNGDFDLVLMDVEMPGLDGIEATTRIRQGDGCPENRKLRIVGLSAHAFHEDRKLALNAGMDDYLTKPLDLIDLQRVLAETTRPIGKRTLAN